MINGLLTAALLPVAILLYYIYRVDKNSPEPTSQLVKAFFFGMLSIPITLAYVYPLELSGLITIEPTTILEAIKVSFLGAALPEEGAKLLMLWLVLRNNHYFNERLDGIVYAVFVSLGFAALENIIYLATSGDSYIVVGITRGLMSVPLHFSCGVLMGYFYSLASFNKSATSLRMLLAYLIPVMVHGIYDSVLFSLSASAEHINAFVFITIFFALIIFGIVILLICDNRIKRLRILDIECLPQTNSMSTQYRPQPLDCSDVELGNDVDELLEAMSKNVHEVWAQGRINEGWSYGELRDEVLKKHPCIIPYEELSELEKDYDRRTATATLKFILKKGYKITKE